MISVNIQSSILISGNVKIYFDPIKMDKKYDADYIFITHSHYDHFSKEDVLNIKNDRTVIICPYDVYDNCLEMGFKESNVFKVKPYAVEKVETSRGKVIYQAPKTRVMKVLNLNTAAVITAMLKTVVQNGTARSASIGKPAAAKTGTTDDNKDASFYGYTPDIVTGIWVGNDDNTKMNGVYGGTIPALIWRDTMKVATQKFGSTDFDYPPVELKRTAKAAVKTIENEDISEEPPKPEIPSGSAEQNLPMPSPAQNPVSFNNTFLDPNAQQRTPQPVQPSEPPVPPIPAR